jgi:hypothetical protein
MEFTLNGTTPAWLALGITDTPGTMGQTDVMMCWFRNAAPAVSDRFNPSTGVSLSDATQDLVLVTASYVGGVTSCTLTRPLAATEASEDRSILPGSVALLWAMGPLASTEATPNWHGSLKGALSATLLEEVPMPSGSGSGDYGSDPDSPGYTPPAQDGGGGGGGVVAMAVDYTSDLATTCSFNYDTAVTPTIASINPTSGAGQTSIVIAGTGFTAEPTVYVGDTEAVVSDYTATSVTVVVPAMTAGDYFVRVDVPGVGCVALSPL